MVYSLRFQWRTSLNKPTDEEQVKVALQLTERFLSSMNVLPAESAVENFLAASSPRKLKNSSKAENKKNQ